MQYRFPMDLLNDPDLHWSHFTGTPRFGYPIDYWGAILHVGDDGHLDFAYRWAPNSYCHFHRHLCSTTSTVIAGELHVTDCDEDGNETGVRVRRVGDYSHTVEPDVHMERGGPDGAIAVFNLYAPDGLLTDVLADDHSVIRTNTVEQVTEAWRRPVAH